MSKECLILGDNRVLEWNGPLVMIWRIEFIEYLIQYHIYAAFLTFAQSIIEIYEAFLIFFQSERVSHLDDFLEFPSKCNAASVTPTLSQRLEHFIGFSTIKPKSLWMFNISFHMCKSLFSPLESIFLILFPKHVQNSFN